MNAQRKGASPSGVLAFRARALRVSGAVLCGLCPPADRSPGCGNQKCAQCPRGHNSLPGENPHLRSTGSR